MRIEDALASYLVQLEADGRSRHTTAQARRHVSMFVAWVAANGGVPPIEDVRHELVARFLASDAVKRRADGEQRKPTSANALRSSLRAFFGYVHASGTTATNPARLVKRARCGSAPPRALSEIDRVRLLATLERASTPVELRDRCLLHLLLGAGLRVGSALGLDVEDVDLAAGQVRLRHMKNADQGVAFVPPAVAEFLRSLIGSRQRGPLFVGASGRRLGGRQALRRLEIWVCRAGLDRGVRLHDLRHSFAVRIYQRTGDLLLTSRALNHRAVSSTATYARCDPERLRLAVAG